MVAGLNDKRKEIENSERGTDAKQIQQDHEDSGQRFLVLHRASFPKIGARRLGFPRVVDRQFILTL